MRKNHSQQCKLQKHKATHRVCRKAEPAETASAVNPYPQASPAWLKVPNTGTTTQPQQDTQQMQSAVAKPPDTWLWQTVHPNQGNTKDKKGPIPPTRAQQKTQKQKLAMSPKTE